MTAPMVVDAHAHFYRPAAPVADGIEGISSDDLLRDAAAAGVGAVLQVTPLAMGFDNGPSVSGASGHPDRVRVMARFDPRATDLERMVDRTLSDPIVVGVRITELPLDGPWLIDGTLDALLAVLRSRMVPTAIYAPNRQAELARLAERLDPLPIIVDHAGVDVLPVRPVHERLEGWDGLTDLARLPNVTIKASGLFEALEEDTPHRGVRDRIRELCDRFGPSRVHWASNYPVCARACGYAESLEVSREACSHLAGAEVAEVFGGSITGLLGVRW